MEYSLWDNRKFMGMLAEVRPRRNYWLDLLFGFEIRSDNEWIDFEKIPTNGRVAAPYVMPLAEGRPVFELATRVGRFKPAYTKLKDVIDPLMGLVKIAGSGEAIFDPSRLSIMERRELIRIQMNAQHVEAIETLWELQAAQAAIFGGYTVSGIDYPAVTLNFGRSADLTVLKGAGTYWGDAGVSVLDDFQTLSDRMIDAPFGAVPTRATMGLGAWARMRNNEEILKHMDTTLRGGAATIDRGLTGGTFDKTYKVGELQFGGGSGQSIELFVSAEKYQPRRGEAEVPFLPTNAVVLSGSANAYQGYRCFGTIVDPNHEYAALPISGRNWQETGDPAVEYMLHQSSPVHVPVNANATSMMMVGPNA